MLEINLSPTQWDILVKMAEAKESPANANRKTLQVLAFYKLIEKRRLFPPDVEVTERVWSITDKGRALASSRVEQRA